MTLENAKKSLRDRVANWNFIGKTWKDFYYSRRMIARIRAQDAVRQINYSSHSERKKDISKRTAEYMIEELAKANIKIKSIKNKPNIILNTDFVNFGSYQALETFLDGPIMIHLPTERELNTKDYEFTQDTLAKIHGIEKNNVLEAQTIFVGKYLEAMNIDPNSTVLDIINDSKSKEVELDNKVHGR